MDKIILASASPRRRELLTLLNIDFEVIPSECEEIISSDIPSEVVKQLSNIKANDVYERTTKRLCNITKSDDRIIVIGSDTMVAANNTILGKPVDRDDAYNMIDGLRGKVHQVYTGVTVIVAKKNDNKYEINHNKSFYVCTDVYVNDMTKKQIEEYIDTDEPYDKAGGYGIQGYFSRHIEKICGDYFNVVGLPVSKVYDVLCECEVIL